MFLGAKFTFSYIFIYVFRHLNALFVILEIKSSCSGSKIEKHFVGVFYTVDDTKNHHQTTLSYDMRIFLFWNY